MKKKRSIKELWKEAWALQSRFIRESAANFQGYVDCYTCYKTYHWKELQAGHFIHGSYDFDIRHIKPQCVSCNKWGHGKPLEFYLHLVSEYGPEIAGELRTRAHWNGYKRKDLEEVILKYK